MATLVPVLLAGGAGSRLWPLSREFYPKQLLHLTGKDSLLQQAARRALSLAGDGPILTVTAESHYFSVLDQLGEVDPRLAAHLLLEPHARDTAAAVTLAALYARAHLGEVILWIVPADHVVTDAAGLERCIERALPSARAGHPTVLALSHAQPHWHLPALTAEEQAVGGLLEVTAQPRSGGLPVFATGMCLLPVTSFLAALSQHAPELLSATEAAWERARSTRGAWRVPGDAWSRVPPTSLHAVLSSQGGLRASLLEAGWADVGSWQSLWETCPHDPQGNVTEGDVLIERSRNCLVRADKRLVTCVGVENLAVVETADAVLVADLTDAGGVMEIVRRLRAQGRSEATSHLNDRRPWGSYSVLLEGPRYKIKEIEVKPGARLSLQMHHHRSEHWVVIAGTARVTRGEEVEFLSENQSTYIPVATPHRLENPGRIPLRIIEVQNGSYVGEDDIVRFDDAYGREDRRDDM